MVSVLSLVQASTPPAPSTILQAIWLGLLIVFVFSVFTSGFTAKKIDNIHDPNYSKAFLATLLKNMLGLTGFAVFGLFFQAPVVVAIGMAVAVIPIAIYKVVFGSMWREAALIWIVTLIVEAGIGYGLTVVGLVSLAAFTGA